MNGVKRSPLFYVGDKYKLIRELKEHFPRKITRFIEPFVGGGSVFLNVNADTYLLNDIDENIKRLHEFLIKSSDNQKRFFEQTHFLIKRYNLSRSFFEDVVPKEMQRKWKKTYYAHYNKEGYKRMRDDFNSDKCDNDLILYLLLIYGFNRMLRFNSKGIFNLPVGNVDFNSNVVNALEYYFNFVKGKTISWSVLDFKDFINSIDFKEGDFIYLDPPYLISFSEYNKLWNENRERELLDTLDALNKEGVRFAISNMVSYKNRTNKIFQQWMRKYNAYKIKSNYISYHDNTKKETFEVLVTNYEEKKSRIQTLAFYNNNEES